MSGFSPDWLGLREPADHAARDPGLIARLSGWAGGRALRIADLGCGTGSTHRALSPVLPGADWLLVDYDPALLTLATGRTGARGLVADLAQGVEAVLDRPLDLVTGSALIDLCSAAWLDRLAAALPRGAALYMALSYDGVEVWEPAHPAEPKALDAFNAHQRSDKGFGPALGPGATAHLAGALAARGWQVATAASPWRLGPESRPLIEALADGSADAVAETGALSPGVWRDWRAARRAAARVMVGHLDLLALPGA